MASLEQFMIQGNTVLVTCSSSTGGTATQLTTGGIQGAYLNNPTTVPVYVAFSQSSAVQATVPSTTTPSLGACITNYFPRVFAVPPNCWVSAVTSAGSATLYVTPGFGN